MARDFARSSAVDIGPVELIVLDFPGQRADPDVIAAISEVTSRGYVTVLDLVWVTHGDDGELVVIDFDEDLAPAGLESFAVGGQGLLSDDDLDLVRECLPAGMSAAVILFENTWARKVTSAVIAAGGEVMLHLQLPHDVVENVMAPAASGPPPAAS
jgi:hypothetical protein